MKEKETVVISYFGRILVVGGSIEQLLQRLLNQKELTDLHGFFNRNGEPYVASVKITESGAVEFLGGGESTSSSDDDELCDCPVCSREQ